MSRQPSPRNRGPQPRAASPKLPQRQTVIAAIIAGIVTCSLVAGLVGTVWLDQASAPPTGEPVAPSDGETGSFETAMRAAIAENPEDAVALVSLANLLALRGDLAEAIGLYERALAVDPDNAATRRAFALALAQAGKLADAELQYRRVLEANPNDAEALLFLGQVYERWSPPRLGEAAAVYARAVAAEPGSVSADEAAKALARLPAGVIAATPVATPE